MAGRPRQRAMVLELEQRTRIHFLDNDHTPLDYVDAWQEEGGTIVQLAEQVSAAARLAPELSADQITRWLRSTFGAAAVSARLAPTEKGHAASYSEFSNENHQRKNSGTALADTTGMVRTYCASTDSPTER